MRGLGNRVRILRYKAGWSQEMLAQKLGISIYFLSQIENDNVDVYYELLVKMALLFKLPVFVLLTFDNDVEVVPTELGKIEQQIKEYDEYITLLKARITR